MKRHNVMIGACTVACWGAGLTTLLAIPLAAQQSVATTQFQSTASARTAENVLVRPVSLQLTGVSLERAIEAVAAHAKVLIQYRASTVEAYRTSVSVQLDNVTLASALERVLAGTQLRVVADGIAGLAIVAADGDAIQERGTIAGKVRHAKTKAPLAGATVTLDDAAKGVVTDEDGSFRLPAAPGEHMVHVRGLGFTRQSQRVTVTTGQLVGVEFGLEPSASVLNEVIVTGTVVATERKAIPNPITVITASDIEKRGVTRIDQLLRGEVPGVVAIEKGSLVYEDKLGSMATTNVYTRGASTLSGGTTPLKTYVDGVELLDPSYLGTIDPKSIERIEIITGPQAATVYGSGAMGGVMQIFTKKGSGGAPDLTLSLRYGTLQNSLNDGLAPRHTDGLTISGGSGPSLSYAGTLSYQYSGQWMPGLFTRAYGTSIGATHTAGPVTASGTVAANMATNGTFSYSTAPLEMIMESNGEWNQIGPRIVTRRQAQSQSQTTSLNLDYRATSFWQHHLTIGRNQTNLSVVPQAPMWSTPSDTMFYTQRSTGQRTTFGYNTTLTSAAGLLSSTLTLGVTGSSGDQVQVTGSFPAKTATSYVSPYVSSTLDDKSWGGFGRLQVGIFDQLYLTFGLRAEKNPNYGRARRVDWTPTNGATYTIEHGDLTLKLLGSYGRATRPPAPDYRLEQINTVSDYDIGQYIFRFGNADLTPEYARGPQGGIEIYYGNVGAFTVNHYSQTVTDLIQSIQVDSVPYVYLPSNSSGYFQQYQYVNAAQVRQQGWEATGSVTLGPIGLKGTYSWTDSRVLRVHPQYSSSVREGSMFVGVPTHIGNVTATYARGKTSVTVVTNMMGTMLQDGFLGPRGQLLWAENYASRNKMYIARRKADQSVYAAPGYAKSDVAISHRVAAWATLDLNVTNVGNSYGSEGSFYFPALGRQTLMGLTIRYPRR